MFPCVYSALPAQIIAKGDRSPRKRKIVMIDDAKTKTKKTLLKDDEAEDDYDGRAIGKKYDIDYNLT